MSRHHERHHRHHPTRAETAAEMRADPKGRRLYGPLWPVLTDVWGLNPATNLDGLATLVALCCVVGDVGDLRTRISRPRPGMRMSVRSWMASYLPDGQPAGDFTVDDDLLQWVAGDQARRIWAVTGIIWGLDRATIIGAFDELLDVGARPAPLPAPTVATLATADPPRLPALLVRDVPIDMVATSYARSLGSSGTGGVAVNVPAAFGASAAALAANPAEGVAAVALLIRAVGHPDVTPETIVSMCRAGTAASRLASILARLWSKVLNHDPEVPAPS
jgi:hypothetical protein